MNYCLPDAAGEVVTCDVHRVTQNAQRKSFDNNEKLLTTTNNNNEELIVLLYYYNLYSDKDMVATFII